MKKKRGELRLKEIARMDTEPRTITPPFFNGQWGVFPFPDRNVIVASDIVNGLVVMSLGKKKNDDDSDSDSDSDSGSD